jgi:hypothetical protein
MPRTVAACLLGMMFGVYSPLSAQHVFDNSSEPIDDAAGFISASKMTPLTFDDSVAAAAEASPSSGKAFLRSLLIPGWGQKAVGAKTSARTFFVAELALWTGFAALQIRGNWLEDDYRLFATTHAGVDPQGKNKDYFVDVGNFNNIDDYNNAQLRNRDATSLYDPASFHWQWDSETNRRRFDDLRVRSEQAFSNSSFLVAGVFANHVISGIHAAHVARRREAEPHRGSLPAPRIYVAASAHDIRLVARVKF